MNKSLLYLLPLAIIIAIPLLLRKPAEALDLKADPLIIVSAHNEAIRYEFEQAFRKYYFEKTGRKVCLDWRAIGGTSEISRYVVSAFTSNFKVYWTTELHQKWNDEVANAFMNRKLTAQDHPARKAFLESNIGIGVDLFFGGGQYDLNKQAQMGNLVPCGFRERHPEALQGENPPFIQARGGEIWYDKNDCYYACCFSSFGICMNLDRLAAHFPDKPSEQLTSWQQLAAPQFYGEIGLADPTKSGSINKAFEMLVQRQMLDTMTALTPQLNSGILTQKQALNQAWKDAMTLIKKVGANSRYLTFSASKVPVDCATGQITAGMCIDFYGRTQAQWEEEHVGRKTMLYTTPVAASSVSADPIGLLRGAPNKERAQMFIDFVLSPEGQKLWNYKVGTPGGPIKYSLNRLPCRQDLYTEEHRPYMSAPEAQPFQLASSFTYHGEWTGAYFDLLRNIIKVMLIDCETELKDAWRAILQAGGPEACPEAMAFFSAMPFEHENGAEAARRLGKPDTQTQTLREWGSFFRNNFKKAQALAQKSNLNP